MNESQEENDTAARNGTGLIFSNFQAHQFWIAFVVIETVMLIVTAYVLVMLLYGIITNGSICKSLRRRISTSRSTLRSSLVVSVTIYSAVTLCKFILAEIVAFTEPLLENCSIYAKANRVIHISGFTSLGVFLWLRQRVLYNMPQLKHLATTCITWWSNITLFVVGLAAVSGVVLVINPFKTTTGYWLNDGRCFRAPEGLSASASIGVMSCIVVQGSLLALFIRIVGKKRFRKHRVRNLKMQKRTNKTQALVKRCCSLTGICILTDLSSLIAITFLKGHVSELVMVLILDIDQFMNLWFAILCFAQWKDLVFPWRLLVCAGSAAKAKRRESSSGTSAAPTAVTASVYTNHFALNTVKRQSVVSCVEVQRHLPLKGSKNV
ncbi:uncharacterized protein LOC100181940 [Ciona intestinalis]